MAISLDPSPVNDSADFVGGAVRAPFLGEFGRRLRNDVDVAEKKDRRKSGSHDQRISLSTAAAQCGRSDAAATTLQRVCER